MEFFNFYLQIKSFFAYNLCKTVLLHFFTEFTSAKISASLDTHDDLFEGKEILGHIGTFCKL